MSLRVAVVGGGPGGLFLASQLKRQDPTAEVVVLERNQAEDAFGFGVVFSDSTLNQILAADPVVRDALAEQGTHWDRIEVWLKGERRAFHGNGMAAIHRRVLLPVLQQRAREAGVDLRFGVDVTPELVARLRSEHDLVVGADGASSVVRRSIEDDLGHRVETATAKFIWFGTRHIFDGLTFVHRRSEHGSLAAHAYPISDDISTFIVETGEETWRSAGFDAFDVTQPAGPSDERTRAYLADLFADDLQGAEIVANNSRWASFRTRRTERWHSGNVVLLGDAVHTAHFSVGSGTKMAMEDGIVLARELAGATPGDLARALTAYEADRQPPVRRIQDAASGGLSWWEHFGRYHEAFEPTQFGFHFFSRSIDIDRIEPRDPQLVKEVRADWEDRHGAPALETPLAYGDQRLDRRLLGWSEGRLREGDRVVPDVAVLDASHGAPADVAARAAAGSLTAVVGGSVLDRVLLSEELRLGRGLPTALVVGADERADPETMVLAGRADVVAVAAEVAR